mmetsp:Transcript_18665/g.51067  ORF Transcript_18665/g.51067 Transcript_18665/m.51067 type:complete len:313 (+) Transcript_18665:1756-2694(+)
MWGIHHHAFRSGWWLVLLLQLLLLLLLRHPLFFLLLQEPPFRMITAGRIDAVFVDPTTTTERLRHLDAGLPIVNFRHLSMHALFLEKPSSLRLHGADNFLGNVDLVAIFQGPLVGRQMTLHELLKPDIARRIVRALAPSHQDIVRTDARHRGGRRSRVRDRSGGFFGLGRCGIRCCCSSSSTSGLAMGICTSRRSAVRRKFGRGRLLSGLLQQGLRVHGGQGCRGRIVFFGRLDGGSFASSSSCSRGSCLVGRRHGDDDSCCWLAFFKTTSRCDNWEGPTTAIRYIEMDVNQSMNDKKKKGCWRFLFCCGGY